MKRLAALSPSLSLSLSLFFSLASAAEITADTRIDSAPDAAAILAKSEQVYRELNTYRDVGVVEKARDSVWEYLIRHGIRARLFSSTGGNVHRWTKAGRRGHTGVQKKDDVLDCKGQSSAAAG
ncbi:MAG: hypothetical protein ABI905_01355 [Betaproteobacteria bacterium]